MLSYFQSYKYKLTCVCVCCLVFVSELEKALGAARESIQKRFPDSVANLLYTNIAAARTGEGVCIDWPMVDVM
jgi:hypothetical protein